jgi:RNA polymerase sigma-B factor
MRSGRRIITSRSRVRPELAVVGRGPSKRPAPEAANGAVLRSGAGVRPSAAAGRERARTLLREYHRRGDLQARERLIQEYMPLVKSLARRHSSRGEQYEDLVQVGCIGLIKAVDRFDLERRVEFGAFAIPNIAGEIKRYLRDRGWPIKVPRRLQELRSGLCACSAELSAQLERPATIPEIAQRSGVAEPEVAAALATERIQSPVSLSVSADEDDVTNDRLDGILEGGYEQGEQRALLAAGFRALDARERRLLHLRFFAGLSQPQIAREVGISQIHVSRLTRRALAKLRVEMESEQSSAPACASGAN